MHLMHSDVAMTTTLVMWHTVQPLLPAHPLPRGSPNSVDNAPRDGARERTDSVRSLIARYFIRGGLS